MCQQFLGAYSLMSLEFQRIHSVLKAHVRRDSLPALIAHMPSTSRKLQHTKIWDFNKSLAVQHVVNCEYIFALWTLEPIVHAEFQQSSLYLGGLWNWGHWNLSCQCVLQQMTEPPPSISTCRPLKGALKQVFSRKVAWKNYNTRL